MNYFDFNAYHSYIKESPIDNQKHFDYLQSRKLDYINLKEYEYIETIEYEDGYIIPMNQIINIYRSNDKNTDGWSLYELLKNGHGFRHKSLHEFFERTIATSIQTSINWLASKECAFSDATATYGSTGELPSANYYEEIDKYFINTGQNRAFAGLLIGTKEFRVENISYYRPKAKKKSPRY